MKVGIVGATSAIASAIAQLHARKADDLFLVARSAKEVSRLATDLEIKYRVSVEYSLFDFAIYDDNELSKLVMQLCECDIIYIAVGCAGSLDPNMLDMIAKVNYVTPSKLVHMIAHRAGAPKNIAVITSVAGDRGRAANYPYGSTKAALSCYLSGLRNELCLAKSQVHVMEARPGFVDSRMTYGINSKLIVSPKFAAKIIVNALKKEKSIIYVPFFWYFIMLIIRYIPEFVFKKLRI